MTQHTITGSTGTSVILCGESFNNVSQYIPDKKLFIISDTNVHRLYADWFPKAPIFIAEAGESSKSFLAMTKIFEWLLEEGADRNSFILAIGGGVVCDLAGFVAATYMRGVDFGFVSTTLLSQVDASVGGKNGVNLNKYKNIVGTFAQPRFVICDTEMLNTLPEEEFTNGMAEIIKHALIRDADKFEYLEKNAPLVREKNPEALSYLINRSVEIKTAIVQEDEKEGGVRKLLNFGHTWGHAIEKVYEIPHGQAVSIGMSMAAKISVRLGLLAPEQKKRMDKVLEEYKLPIHKQNLNIEKVFEAMLKDKKKEAQSIHYILLEDIGKGIIKKLSAKEIEKLILD